MWRWVWLGWFDLDSGLVRVVWCGVRSGWVGLMWNQVWLGWFDVESGLVRLV